MAIIITFAIVFILASIFKAYSFRKKLQLSVKLVNDAKLSAEKLADILKGMEHHLQEVMMAIKNNTPRGGASRVYGIILQRGFETRLFVHPANTFEVMADAAAKEVGKDWTIIASAHVDIVNEAKTIVLEELDEKPAVKPNVVNYIANLKYASDNFASEPEQKKAIEKIISNIEKQYGKSTSTSR